MNTTVPTPTPTATPKRAYLPFLAFIKDEKELATLKAFAEKRLWPETAIQSGDITTAVEHLKTNPSPEVLLVEVSTPAEASKQMDALAEVCDPDTKVIAIGSVNEYSFYCWLMDIGIFSYLLKPLTAEVLETTLAKAGDKGLPAGQAKAPGKVIAVTGTRGGVGATTFSLNLAGAITEISKKNVALVDIDPREGSVALTLDLEPSRGFREALEKPDRIDSLFIDRVMNRHGKYLSVLSSEESLQEQFHIHDNAADALIKELKDKFDFIILDVPRTHDAFGRKCMALADQVVIVTELNLLCLRDTLRLNDLMREALKTKPPLLVASRTGLNKHEMKISDYEKGVNADIIGKIPFAPDVYTHISSDIPSVKFKAHAAVKPLYQLVGQILPELKPAAPAKDEKGGFFKSKKKSDKDEKA